MYSANMEDHLKHLRRVLETLRRAKLYGKASKCSFAVSEVEYLGFIVSADGIRSDPAKIAPNYVSPVVENTVLATGVADFRPPRSLLRPSFPFWVRACFWCRVGWKVKGCSV